MPSCFEATLMVHVSCAPSPLLDLSPHISSQLTSAQSIFFFLVSYPFHFRFNVSLMIVAKERASGNNSLVLDC